jgi:hypothetical protein
VTGRLSAAQVTRAFRDHVVPPPARLRIRAAGAGYEVDIPSASAGYAGIHPRNDPDRHRDAIRCLEPRLSRAAGVPVAIRSVASIRGGHTVRVWVGPARKPAARS